MRILLWIALATALAGCANVKPWERGYLAKPEMHFQSRVVAGDAVDFTDIGSCRALQIHGTLTVWVVDTTDAGNDSVVVERYLNPITNAPLLAEGDSEATCIFHFDPKATIYGAGT